MAELEVRLPSVLLLISLGSTCNINKTPYLETAHWYLDTKITFTETDCCQDGNFI